MIKLREILEMPVFSGFKIVAGQSGIDRDIGTVSVMDAPDIYKWMKGGEFLITTGYAVKDQPEYIRSLIINLEKGGASALGVKFDRFIHEFPKEALNAADELGFPIISIPFEFAFTDVINPVLREVVNRQSRKMMYTEKIHEAFTKMVLEDEKIPVILEFLKQHIHCEVVFLDTCFHKVYFSEGVKINSQMRQKLKDVFEGTSDMKQILENFTHYRMYINWEEYGYLIIGEPQEDYEESFTDYYRIAIEQAGTILILKIQKQLATARIEESYREQFVQDMLMKNIRSKEEINNRATIYNWDFYAGGIVVIVDIDHFKEQYLEHLDQERNRVMETTMRRILRICKRIVGKEYSRYVYSRLSDQIVFIISEDYENERYFQKRLKEVFLEVKNEITRVVSFTATIGIGNYQKDISQIHDSWIEAKKAIQISRNMKQENIVSVYDELGAYKLLALINDSKEAVEFQQQYVKKLEEYDKKYHTELMSTVLVLISCGWNLKEASERLYIHYNSMKYRYQKICKVLGMDLQTQEQKLNLELALKLYQLNNMNI